MKAVSDERGLAGGDRAELLVDLREAPGTEREQQDRQHGQGPQHLAAGGLPDGEGGKGEHGAGGHDGSSPVESPVPKDTEELHVHLSAKIEELQAQAESHLYDLYGMTDAEREFLRAAVA